MNLQIRILLTVADISPVSGGPARSVPGLARGLVSSGAHAEIVTTAPSNHTVAPTGVPTSFVRVPCSIRRDLREAGQFLPDSHVSALVAAWRDLSVMRPWRAAIRSRLKEGAMDIVHDAGLWLPVNHVTASSACGCRVPRVVSPRGMLEPWARGHRATKKNLAWRLYQRRDLEQAALLHATSGQEAEGLRRAGLRNPIAIVANGIDLPNLVGPRPPCSPRQALFLSRIHPKKGLLDLVRAWATVRPIGWKMTVVGPDEVGHLAEVQDAVREAGVEADFEFLGAIADGAKWPIYYHSDLFVLPTYSENFGLVIGEALASGLPVITTRETPWPEIENERLGWWIPTGKEALAVALREATSLPPEALSAMGARGPSLIAKRYAWSTAAERMLAAYGWLLGRQDRPTWIEVD